MNWSAGYVTDVDYTYGYYREISPRLMDFALLLNGYEPPRGPNLSYLELGYGQGISVNIHAAGVPGRFYGTDFNPAHAANAQALASISQADAHFFDEGFVEFSQRRDLPEFDYIALHGIWSWISDENRKAIVDLIQKRLKIGGVVYISYNALPGWAPAMPLRHILALHAEMAAGEAQSRIQKVDGAISFAREIDAAKARYFAANASVREKLERIAGQDRNYVAHEYFNREWLPMYFSQVFQHLGAAKLSFAGPAQALDTFDHLNLLPEQRKILDGISHPVLKESVRDVLLNTQFRRDLFVKGARKIGALQRLERLKDTRVVSLFSGADFDFSLNSTLGKVQLKREIYEPIVAALQSAATAPETIGAIAAKVADKGVTLAVATEAVAVLVGCGRASPAQADEDIEKARLPCHRLNLHLLERSRLDGNTTFLASPVLGGGINVGRFEQMFLRARAEGHGTPDQWAREAWRHLKAQGQLVMRDGKPLTDEAENLSELTSKAAAFAQTRLPLLRAIQIVE